MNPSYLKGGTMEPSEKILWVVILMVGLMAWVMGPSRAFPADTVQVAQAKEVEVEDDVESWEGFRGFSPRVPYGQGPDSGQVRQEGTLSMPQVEGVHSETSQSKKEPDLKEKEKPANTDEVEPWEGFRGWSPRVPYGE